MKLDSIPHLLALAAKLEGEGQLNNAKLLYAAADAVLIQAAQRLNMPADRATLLTETDRAIAALSGLDFRPEFTQALNQARQALADRRLPLAFEGDWHDLPPEGLDWALEQGFAGQAEGRRPNLASALYIEVAGTHRGQGLSGRMLATMKELVRARGFQHLIAPVRPSMKSRYPLIDIDTYQAWTTPEGQPIDPWLRVHTRAGGRVLHACRKAMVIEGTPDQWAEWTGMEFPADGDYVIPYGLVPVRLRSGWGEYIEPGVWVLHEIG